MTNLGAPWFWCRHILVSEVNPGELWLAGSGYDNSPVFKSTDYGATFTAVNAGMPSTIVERLAFNADESMVYAATGIAPFVFIADENEWFEIAGDTAPLVHYMDVEFLEAQNTVRFATYARGVWDLRIDAASTTAENTAPKAAAIYPNPGSDAIRWRSSEHEVASVVAYNLKGKRFELASGPTVNAASVSELAVGIYFVCLFDRTNRLILTEKILIQR
jgi:hypothetical protein